MGLYTFVLQFSDKFSLEVNILYTSVEGLLSEFGDLQTSKKKHSSETLLLPSGDNALCSVLTLLLLCVS